MRGLCKQTRLGHIGCFTLSCQCVSMVEPEIPSLVAKWLSGHSEDLGMATVLGLTNLLILVSDGKAHRMLRSPGVGHGSVTHQFVLEIKS